MSDEQPDYARLAAALLAREPTRPTVRQSARDHGIGSIRLAMAERERRRGWGQKGWVRVSVGAAAVLVALSSFGAWQARRQATGPVERRGKLEAVLPKSSGSLPIPRNAPPSASEAARPLAVEAPEAPRARASASTKRPVASPSSSVVPYSDLAAQNALYARALRAHRAGRLEEARRLYEALVAGYPGGPLEESATLARMRILAATEPLRAREVARRYLTRFPRGFARSEAEELAE